jgi:hypothetical protein
MVDRDGLQQRALYIGEGFEDISEAVRRGTLRMDPNKLLLLVFGYLVCGFLGLLASIILWFIWTDKIDIRGLLSEGNGQASMSRFQLLFFTFVVGVSFFGLVEKTIQFPDMSGGVLTLLGISASTYAVGKGISYSREEGVTTPDERSDALNKKVQGQVAVAQAAATAEAPAVMVNPPPSPQ